MFSPNRYLLRPRSVRASKPHRLPNDRAPMVRPLPIRTISVSTHSRMNKQINLVINGKGGVGQSFLAQSNSTRRFCARPSHERLLVTGFILPIATSHQMACCLGDRFPWCSESPDRTAASSSNCHHAIWLYFPRRDHLIQPQLRFVFDPVRLARCPAKRQHIPACWSLVSKRVRMPGQY